MPNHHCNRQRTPQTIEASPYEVVVSELKVSAMLALRSLFEQPHDSRFW